MKCPNCNSKVEFKNLFCPNCGVKLDKEELFRQKFEGEIQPDSEIYETQPAPRYKRFLNFLIDTLIINALAFVIVAISYIFDFLPIINAVEKNQSQGLGLLVYFGYYIILEVSFGKTLGKLITRTKVLSYNGYKLSGGQVAGRTFCRLIPLEAFSFLFSSRPMGWHDTIFKTVVVEDKRV